MTVSTTINPSINGLMGGLVDRVSGWEDGWNTFVIFLIKIREHSSFFYCELVCLSLDYKMLLSGFTNEFVCLMRLVFTIFSLCISYLRLRRIMRLFYQSSRQIELLSSSEV